MKQYKEEHRLVTVVKVVVCNMCGVESHYSPFTESEWVNVNKVFGYFSTHFGDMTEIDFDLCEKCLKDIVDKFKIPATHTNRLDP